MEEEEIDRVLSEPDQAPLEEKHRAMLLFVIKAIKSPESVVQEDVEALHGLDWTDRDIFDAVSHGAGMIAPSIMMKAFKM